MYYFTSSKSDGEISLASSPGRVLESNCLSSVATLVRQDTLLLQVEKRALTIVGQHGVVRRELLPQESGHKQALFVALLDGLLAEDAVILLDMHVKLDDAHVGRNFRPVEVRAESDLTTGFSRSLPH